MSPDPLVSVIIPSRNRPELAARAVRSVLAQTYANQEIVVVDDGSEPPLALPEDVIGDPRVRTLRLETTRGAGGARNAGVEASTGSLIAFLDDDDSWRPAKVERQVRVLNGCGADIAAVETGFDVWDGSRMVERYLPRPDRDLRRELLVQATMQPSTILLRRSAFTQLGGFDPAFLRVEDWDLWIRFADSYRAAAVPEVHVDRNLSEAGPDVLLLWYQDMVRRLEPRIAPLPPSERSRVRAAHLLVESSLLARLGRPQAARHKAWRALRENPSGWLRSVLFMTRTVVGEQAWSAARRVLRTRRPFPR